MLERMKSILLILLIGTSVYLTWRILDYQAQYDYLLPAEYVTQIGLAEKKELNELLKPLMLVYHYGDEVHRVIYPDMFQYLVMEEQMKDWYFYNFKKLGKDQLASWPEESWTNQGIELIFPTDLPFSLLSELFHIPSPDQQLPNANRLWLFHDQETDEINAYFFSEAEQALIKARTSLSLGELRTYLDLGESRPPYQAFVFQAGEEKESTKEPTKVHYLPLDPTDMVEYQYFYKRIPINTVLPYLFVDPSLVRKIEERERSSFYTDGSRGLQVDHEELSMYYFHPLSDSNPAALPKPDHYVQRSIQFVNQHQGWEHSYHLFSVEQNELEQKRHIQFRQIAPTPPLVLPRKE